MYFIPYVLFVLYFSFFYLYGGNNSLRKIESKYYAYIFFAFVVCFRWFISQDAFAYYGFFQSVPNVIESIESNYAKWSWWEPGFVYYVATYKLFTDNYLVYQIVDSIIEIIFIYKCFEHYKCNNPFVIMIFFVMNGFWSFDVQRNIKAILIFFYSLKFIEDINNRKWIKYFICLIVAYCFHNSSIIYFLITPFLCIKLTKQKIKIFFFLGIFIAITSGLFMNNFLATIQSFLPGRIGNMIDEYVLNKGQFSIGKMFSLGTIEKILTFYLILRYFDTLKQDNSIIIKTYILYFLFYFCFFSLSEVSNRLSLLFVFSYWVIIYKVILAEKRKSIKLFMFICILIYCLLKMSLYNKPHQSYNNILFLNCMTLEERERL